MRVLADTNILFSSLLYPNSVPAAALRKITSGHDLVLCDVNITELLDIVRRKAPNNLSDAETFLEELPHDLIAAGDKTDKQIRDPKDQPILNSAIQNQVDIIVTGDKDFLTLTIEHPECMTASEFLKRYGD